MQSVIYNTTTGAILTVVTTANAALIEANTPSGCSALEVDAGHAAIAAQGNWTVVGGVLTEVTPTDTELLASAQSTQSAVIQSSFQNATYNTPIGYMGSTFFTDQTSQNMLTGALTVLTPAGATPDGFSWWDTDDKAVPMTLTQLQGLALTILMMFNTNFIKQKSLLASINAATTVAAVQVINW